MQRRSYTKPIIRLVKDHDHRSGHDLIRLSVEHPAPIVSEVMRYDANIHQATNTEYLVIQQMLHNYEQQVGTNYIRDALNVLSNKHANDTGEYAIRQAISYLEHYLREHATAKLTPANYLEFIEDGSRRTPSAQEFYGKPKSYPKSVRGETVNGLPFSDGISNIGHSFEYTDDYHADATIWSLPGGN